MKKKILKYLCSVCLLFFSINIVQPVFASSEVNTLSKKIVTGGLTQENIYATFTAIACIVLGLIIFAFAKRVFGWLVFLVAGPNEGDWWVRPNLEKGGCTFEKVIKSSPFSGIHLQGKFRKFTILTKIPISQFPEMTYTHVLIDDPQMEKFLEKDCEIQCKQTN